MMTVSHSSGWPGLDATALTHLVEYKVARFTAGGRTPPTCRDDLQQEVLLRVLPRLKHYDETRSSRQTFVSRIIDFILIDMWRETTAKKRNPKISIILGKPRGLTGLSSIDEVPECLESRSHRSPEVLQEVAIDVLAAIHDLPPQLQQLAIDLQELSVSEIAKRDGLHRSTILRRKQELQSLWKNSTLRGYVEP